MVKCSTATGCHMYIICIRYQDYDNDNDAMSSENELVNTIFRICTLHKHNSNLLVVLIIPLKLSKAPYIHPRH